MDCELCSSEMALFCDDNAFVRYDNNSLSKGHVLIVPRRHVADFFEMTWAEKRQLLLCWRGQRSKFHKNTRPMATTLVSISVKRRVNHACAGCGAPIWVANKSPTALPSLHRSKRFPAKLVQTFAVALRALEDAIGMSAKCE